MLTKPRVTISALSEGKFARSITWRGKVKASDVTLNILLECALNVTLPREIATLFAPLPDAEPTPLHTLII